MNDVTIILIYEAIGNEIFIYRGLLTFKMESMETLSKLYINYIRYNMFIMI